jgi:hypothetical protein
MTTRTTVREAPVDEKTARHMDRLLAQEKRLSGPEADAILERVLAKVEREEKRPRAIRAFTSVALAAAAAVLLVVYVPRAPDERQHTVEEGDMSPLVVSCSPGTLSACPSSSALVFTLKNARASGVLSAYAEPLGPGAEPVFYFSKEDGSASLDEGTRSRSVRLPAAQDGGRYRIHALLAPRALSRQELLQGASGIEIVAKARVELVVTD